MKISSNAATPKAFSVEDAKLELKNGIGKKITVNYKCYGKSIKSLSGELLYITDTIFGVRVSSANGSYTQSFMFRDLFTSTISYSLE